MSQIRNKGVFEMMSSWVHIIFLFFFLLGCSSADKQANKTTTISFEASSNDTIPTVEKQVRIEVNGKPETIILSNNKKLDWRKSYAGYEEPLRIREVHPGILFVDKYHTEIISPTKSESPKKIHSRMVGRIEFYDEHFNLIISHQVSDFNPYLNVSENIFIKQQFSDGEQYSFAEKYESDKIIIQRHVSQWVENQSAFSIMTFRKNDIDKQNSIVDNATTSIILNAHGHKIFHHEHRGFGSTPVISPDVKFVLLSFHPEESVHKNMGFEIWNVENNSLLHKEVNTESGRILSTPATNPDEPYLSIGYSYPNADSLVSLGFAFDYTSQKLYKTKTTIEDLDRSNMHFKKHRRYPTFKEILATGSAQEIKLNYGSSRDFIR